MPTDRIGAKAKPSHEDVERGRSWAHHSHMLGRNKEQKGRVKQEKRKETKKITKLKLLWDKDSDPTNCSHWQPGEREKAGDWCTSCNSQEYAITWKGFTYGRESFCTVTRFDFSRGSGHGSQLASLTLGRDRSPTLWERRWGSWLAARFERLYSLIRNGYKPVEMWGGQCLDWRYEKQRYVSWMGES